MRKWYKTRTIWFLLINHGIALFSVLYGLFVGYPMLTYGLFIAFYCARGLGITIGYHRMHTHNSFTAPRLVRKFILACGMAAAQGTPDNWKKVHIKHHETSDQQEDPHSPVQRGLFWAHMGWLVAPHTSLSGEATKDEKIVTISCIVLGYVIPAFILLLYGGIGEALKGAMLVGSAGIVCVWHTTWSVNSFTHWWGNRPFQTPDNSRNSFLIALLTFGEGWHNNHHAFRGSAFHGLHWFEIDTSGIVIRIMKRIGLAKNVVEFKKEQIQKVAAALKQRQAAKRPILIA